MITNKGILVGKSSPSVTSSTSSLQLLRMGTRLVLLDTCCDISASCSVNDRCTDGDDSCCCPLLIVIPGKTKSEIVSIIIVKVDNSFIFLDNVLSTPKTLLYVSSSKSNCKRSFKTPT